MAQDGHQNSGEKQKFKGNEKEVIDYCSLDIGDEPLTGYKIKKIFSVDPNYISYLSENPNAGEKRTICFHHTDPLPNHFKSALQEFRELTSETRTILNESQQEHACNLIAAGLTTCLTSKEGDDLSRCFERARRYIETKAFEVVRSKYLGFTMIIAILITGLLGIIYYFLPIESKSWQSVITSCITGVVGAMISVLQRGRSQEIDSFASPFHLAFDALIRMIIGMCFGGIVVVASYADIAFGIAKENPFALMFFSLCGGFSERLIPDLIERTVKTEAKTK